MSKRNRMTRRQATDRKASAPPATPGYGTEDQGHPAHTQEDPEASQYENGDTSSWAEDVHPPPYPDGNPPADPGYDVEDQDHPAHKRQPRLPKSAKSLRAQVVKKADKCIRLARHTLGKEASTEMVEDQALDYMDMPDEQLNKTLERLGGGFLAQDDLMLDDEVMVEDEMVDALLAEDDEEVEVEEDVEMACGPKYSAESVMAKLEALTAEVKGLKNADQNDPKGDTLAPKPQTEEQERAEGAATAKDEHTASPDNPIAVMFDQFDTDNDGFVSQDEWRGSKAVFASLDTDGDGIIARDEVVASFYAQDVMVDDLYTDLDPDEAAMLAEMMDEDDGVEGMEEMIEEGMEIMSAKKSEDDEDDDSSDKEAAKKKSEDDEDDDNGDDNGDDDQDEEADEDSDKESSVEADMFSMQGDPMGLATEDSVITEDDSLLMDIFGGDIERVASKKSEDEEEKKEDEEEAEEEAAETIQEEDEEEAKDKDEKEGGKKKATQRPQPKKASKGVAKVGHVQPAPAGGNEVNELSQLWDSEPDVSSVFGVKGSAE